MNNEITFVQEMSDSYSFFSNRLSLVKGICLDIFKDEYQELDFNEYSNSLTITLPRATFEQKTYDDLTRLWELGFKQITLIEKKVTTFRKEFKNGKKEK